MRRTIGETTGERRDGSSRAGDGPDAAGPVVTWPEPPPAGWRRPNRAGADAARFVAVVARVP